MQKEMTELNDNMMGGSRRHCFEQVFVCRVFLLLLLFSAFYSCYWFQHDSRCNEMYLGYILTRIQVQKRAVSLVGHLSN